MKEKETKSDDLMYDVKNIKQFENYTLPSKGLVYEEVENIPASITLRRMTTKEDKMRMRNADENSIRKAILQACIVEEGVDVGRLKLIDFNFLLFRLRVLSLLIDTYKVNCYCSKCGTNFINEIELSKLKVKYLSKTNLNDLKIELPFSKCKVHLKYPSIDSMLDSIEVAKEYVKSFPEEDFAEVMYITTSLLYISEVILEDKTKLKLKEELEVWFENLDLIDSRTLKEHMGVIDDHFGLQTYVTTKCANQRCKADVEHIIPITKELLSPSK